MTTLSPVLPAMAMPVVDGVGGIERRVCSRVLQWWRDLAAPRRTPSRATIDAADSGEFGANLFILRCAADPSGNVFEHAGPTLRSALGRDPTGLDLAAAWPAGALARASFLQRSCAELLTPIDEAGRWSLAGEDIVYRCVLMPVCDDEGRTTHLLGAFSFRRLAYA
jgi:hypothetical protein